MTERYIVDNYVYVISIRRPFIKKVLIHLFIYLC